jgi:N-formylglutamate amidohydrolase
MLIARPPLRWSTDAMESPIGQPAADADPEGPGAPDPVLENLHAAPFAVAGPAVQRIPFVFASPHSGRLYPARFLAQSRLSGASLRRSEDAFTDELFGGVVELGAPLLAARFPRAYVDANREPAELDPAMFDGPLPVAADASSPRVQAGLGVIPRIVRDGADIYRGKLDPAEAPPRLARLHRPYHEALDRLVQETRQTFGAAIVIDCHSMPSAAASPDIVLGDRYGTAAAYAVMRRAEQAFQQLGFSVARNVPYAGGYTTHVHGRPAQGVHALQVEINRALYLDEERVVPNARYADLQLRLSKALSELAQIDVSLLRPRRDIPWAAE